MQSDRFSSKILTIICGNFETVQDRMSDGLSIGTDIGDLK